MLVWSNNWQVETQNLDLVEITDWPKIRNHWRVLMSTTRPFSQSGRLRRKERCWNVRNIYLSTLFTVLSSLLTPQSEGDKPPAGKFSAAGETGDYRRVWECPHDITPHTISQYLMTPESSQLTLALTDYSYNNTTHYKTQEIYFLLESRASKELSKHYIVD